MTRASGLFSAEEKQTIEAAIGEAEQRTVGEIVPVVVTASGRYDRAEDLFGLVVAVAALTIVWLLFQGVKATGSEWAAGYALSLGLLPVLVIVVAGFLLGAVAATFVPALRLPFISASEMDEEVERSATAAFQRFRVRGTKAGTGVLIYVSLFEHRVRVLGDDAIHAKVTQADWDGVCSLVVEGLRAGKGADGLVQAIRKAGELLTTHFPIQPGDRNEIPNRLHLID